jgi:flavin-dependent dehydrogenase
VNGRAFDVVIVGAGPAGTSTALHLVRDAGIAPGRILVIDKACFPRDKPCAGAISQVGVDTLGAIGVHVPVPLSPMRGLRVIEGASSASSRTVDLGIVVRRDEFDHALLLRAAQDGVQVLEGHALSHLERIPSGHRLRTAPGVEITANWLVVADGAGSTARKLLKVPEAARKGHLYVLETELSAGDDGPREGLCDFDFGPCAAGIEGYYWDFPTPIQGNTWVSRGIYHANFTPHKGLKAALASELRRRGLSIEQPTLRAFSTRPFVPGSVGGGAGYLLVGEAFGIDHATGEGIAQAIVMGRIAARHLGAALRCGSLDVPRYERDVRGSRLGRHLLQSAWFAQRVFSARGAWYRRFLARSSFGVEAGARWYRGDAVGTGTKLRLAIGMARELAWGSTFGARASS